MKRILLSAFVLSALVAAPALAADLSQPAPPAYKAPPPPAPVYSWTGCYVAAGGGYGMWNQDVETVRSDGALWTQTTAGGRGWFGTVQVGCDYQLSSDWVIGAFGDWDFGNIHGKAAVWEDYYFGNEKARWAWSAGARLGYVVMPNLLAFVSGGWREAHFNGFELIDPFVLNAPPGDHINAHTYSGWFVGSGYEYALKWLPGFFWKTEYRFTQYGSANLPVIVDSTGLPQGETVRSKKFEQTIRSELVWRFNWGGPVRAAY